MSVKGKRIRNELVDIWVENVAPSTANRDTLCNDLQTKYMVPNWYMSCKYPPLKADVDA